MILNLIIVIFLLLSCFLLALIGAGWGGVYYLGPLKISMKNLKNIQIMFYIFLFLKMIIERSKCKRQTYDYLPKKESVNKEIYFWGIVLSVVLAIILKNVISGYFVFDDFINLTAIRDNFRAFVIDFSSVYGKDIKFFRPLYPFSLLAVYKIFGFNVTGYHIVNILNHVFNSLLVMCVAYNLIYDRKLSIFVGLLFATLPIQAEAVIIATSKIDLLMPTFYLSSFLTFILYRRFGNKWHFFLSLIFFLLAILIKDTGISIPLLFLAYDFIYRSKGIFKERARIYIWILILLALYLGIRTFILGGIGGYRSVAGDSRISHLGPQDFIYGLSFNCFRPLFFPINWLTVERFNFYFVKYLLFIYSFILLSIIVFNSPKITRSKPVNIALVYIFITGLMIAGMWEIGRSLSGARFYYLVSFGFYLFIVSLAAPAESGNLIKKRLVFTVLTLLVVFNCIFLKINSFSWEKAGKLSYKILKQTGEIYPELNKIKDSTIFYWKITSQYDGALCMGERIQYALPLFYGKDSPRAAYSGQILNMHNLKEVGLGKKAFYAKWDENKESLSDITPSLISALSQYKNDLKIIRDASKAITEVSSWSNNSHLQKEENSCKIKVLGTSGWLESEVFYLPARACADLILTMKVVPASAKYYSGLYAGRLYWLTDKKNEFSDDRFIEFWIKPNNDYNVYTLIFIGPEEVLNDEIITKFRLMPVLFPAEIEIKDMRLEAKY